MFVLVGSAHVYVFTVFVVVGSDITDITGLGQEAQKEEDAGEFFV